VRNTKAEMQAIIDELLLNGERERRRNQTLTDQVKRFEEKCYGLEMQVDEKKSIIDAMEHAAGVHAVDIGAVNQEVKGLYLILNSLRNDNEVLKKEKHKFELKVMRLTSQVRGLLVALRTMVQTLIEEKDLSA
jgi:hypothetical protein